MIGTIWSLAQLKQSFMTMQMKAEIPVEKRRQMLAQRMKALERSGASAKERDFYRKVTLVSMIRSLAANPAEVLR